MLRSKFFRATLAVLVLPLVLAGCPAIDDMLNPTNYVGSYDLVEVNGSGLPFTMAYVDQSNKLVLERGVWTINSDNSLSTQMSGYMLVSGSRRSFDERHSGTVSVSGTTVQVTLDNGRTATAQLDGDQLLTDDQGNRLRFVKR